MARPEKGTWTNVRILGKDFILLKKLKEHFMGANQEEIVSRALNWFAEHEGIIKEEREES